MMQSRADLPEEGIAVHLLGIASLAAFLVAFFLLFHWNYPDTGHDFGGIFVKFIEGAWHYEHRGLAIPRYAIHVCGGSVLYGNPEDFFYSPAQFLGLVFDPWISMQLTIGAVLVVGYVGWYRVGRDIVRLTRAWSHLLALVVEANGFYFLQMVSGHFMFHALTLLGWFVFLLLDREPLSTRTLLKRTVGFALLCAYALHAGNWLVLYFLVIGFGLVLPLDVYLSESPRRRAHELLVRTGVFGAATLAITASKLVAIYSFMRFFSRHTDLITISPSHTTLSHIVLALWSIPQRDRVLDGMPTAVHEKAMLMAPVTLLGLAVGLGLLARRWYSPQRTARDRWFMALYGAILIALMIGLVGGRGWLAELLHSLPVGASQRASSRYLYIFALLLSVASVWSLGTVMPRLGRRWNTAVLLVSAITTVAAFVFGHVDTMGEIGLASNMRDHRAHWSKVDRRAAVTRVTFFTDFNGATGRTCYEPILNAAGNPSLVLHEGPVLDQSDGYFNLMNPACYQYPDENHCRPGDRIRVDDADNLRRFTTGLPVTWRVSTAQEVADAVSLFALFVFPFVLGHTWRPSVAKNPRVVH